MAPPVISNPLNLHPSDLAHALAIFEGLDTSRVVSCFCQYLQKSGRPITLAMAEERMFAKLKNPGFLADMRPLPSAKILQEAVHPIGERWKYKHLCRKLL